MGLSFTIAAGPRQRSHSQVWVPRTHDHILLSRLPKPGGPGPRIYIPQEQGGSVIPPGTGFPFLRLLRLAGIRWRHSNSPPHGAVIRNRIPTLNSCYIAPTRTAQETSLPLLRVLSLPGKRVHGAVTLQWLWCCRLFTQPLLSNGSTCHNVIISCNLELDPRNDISLLSFATKILNAFLISATHTVCTA
jgi:hypothetical protein